MLEKYFQFYLSFWSTHVVTRRVAWGVGVFGNDFILLELWNLFIIPIKDLEFYFSIIFEPHDNDL